MNRSRIKFVAGGLIGALAATSLVVLGATLDRGDGTGSTKVELSSDEAAAPVEETAAPPVEETTTTTAAPTVPERVAVVEKRVDTVEGKVNRIEATTTTTVPDVTPPGCTRTSAGWTCPNSPTRPAPPETHYVPTTTTTTTTMVTPPPTTGPAPAAVWSWSVVGPDDGLFTVRLRNLGTDPDYIPWGRIVVTKEDGSEATVYLGYQTRSMVPPGGWRYWRIPARSTGQPETVPESTTGSWAPPAGSEVVYGTSLIR